MKEVPVTIIAGPLGAGKTTLLQRILTEEHGLKIAVIMNDFDEATEVEKAMNTASEDDNWVSLPNGCLCCAVKDQAMLALEQLVRRNPLLDHIIIEASGVADPTVLIRRLWVDDALREQVQLDGVVGVIDRLREEQRAIQVKQLALADLIIHSKTDLEGRDHGELHCFLREINPGVAIVPAVRGQGIPLEAMLNIREYRHAAESESSDEALSRLERTLAHLGLDAGCGTEQASVLSLEWPAPISSLADFEREWLFPLLWESSLPGGVSLEWELWRGKGLIQTASGEAWGLQIVGEMYNPLRLTGKKLACGIKLILVGKMDLPTQAQIRASFTQHLRQQINLTR